MSWSACALDGVCDVEDELHVHGSLRHTSATSMDDGDQSAVQLVHVALREEPASGASLVLHLRASTETLTTPLSKGTEDIEEDILNTFTNVWFFITISACVEMRRVSELMPLEVRTAR